MRIRAKRKASAPADATKKWLMVTCACAAWAGGCYTNRPAAKPPVNFVSPVRPIVPQTTAMSLEAPPAVGYEALPVAPQIWPTRQPAKPHVAAPPVDHTETNKPAGPAIAPEVPSEEAKAAQEETQRNLDAAEKNLAMAQGKNLSPMQQDIAAKVKGFADNAREAMKNGDWTRAKSFSSKAQQLAEQLAGSF